MANRSKMISFQDDDGSLSEQLDSYLESEQSKYPDRRISLSGIIRELLRESLRNRQASPRLEDKQKTGSMKK